MARLLRPSGVAVITVPNDPLINRLKQVVRRTPVGWAMGDKIQWGGDVYHLHQWKPAEFERFLAPYFRVTSREAAPTTPCLSAPASAASSPHDRH